MVEFLERYGQWILIGVLFLFMFGLHGRGMGCGMGGNRREGKSDPEAETDKGKKDGQPGSERHSSGCH